MFDFDITEKHSQQQDIVVVFLQAIASTIAQHMRQCGVLGNI